MYKKTILPNNLTLVTDKISGAYSISVGIWFKVGSRYEDNSLSGISHFLEHVVFKGSKKYDSDTIKRQIEGRGGLLNGFTSEELTCYHAKVPQQNAYHTFKILLDMALNPVLKQDDIQKERTVIIEEIKMYNDLPSHLVRELLEKIMWPKHPLGRNITGTEESVDSISRADLLNFKNKYYRPQNMVIVFTGNIEHKDCLNFIDRELKDNRIRDITYSFDEFTSNQSEAKIETLVKDIEQTKLAIGFPAYNKNHPKRFIITLISIILGGNMSSRLFSEIREKRGLVYEIYSQCKQLIDTGAFYIRAGLDNKTIELALNLILKELAKLKNSLVSKPELTRAKEFYLSQLAMALEDTLEHMLFLGIEASTSQKMLDYDEIKKEVLKIEPRDLKEVAREIFKKDKINISLVGPIEELNKDKCLDYSRTNLA